ncbi:MAG TPA: DUF4384 domain-containing protein, partial [Pyrinomonadaceae bacterium]|nr:DUF4384 domain-containing protein [Pyrinomonadaceae bacterium]
LDLGIAKMREIAGGDNGGNTALTMAGQVLGTPYYMSPEQWGEIPRDGSTEIDGRADIYSLGLVFYEMVSGKRPFKGNTLHELRREHVTTSPRPLHEVVPDVPRGFSDAIERATAKDRGDRQPTANALSNELRAGLATSPGAGGQSADFAETMALKKELETNSDVNAPTILTLDPSPTAASAGHAVVTNEPTVYEPAKRAPSDMSGARVAESASMASSVTIQQAPKPAPDLPATAVARPASSKGKAGLLIAAVVVLIVTVAAGVGGFWLWNRSRSITTAGSSGPNVNGSGEVANVPAEISRYWLELAPQSTRVAGLEPIASGKSFKFHFTFNEEGYLYIFGPGGDSNQPTAFLTTKPLARTGVKSNKVTNGVEFSFPSGSGNNLTLDKNAGTDSFTVIFSRTQLPSPSFLNEPVTGEPLSASQQDELKSFVGKYQEKRTIAELDESNGRAPFVRVKATPDQTGNPIVFDIRIQHN